MSSDWIVVMSCTALKFYYSSLNYQRRQWHPTPVLLPGKSHGWRRLVGYSPWGLEESDTTERLHSHFSLSCIGEGNGNPLQCSCLENPRDGGSLVGCSPWQLFRCLPLLFSRGYRFQSFAKLDLKLNFHYYHLVNYQTFRK